MVTCRNYFWSTHGHWARYLAAVPGRIAPKDFVSLVYCAFSSRRGLVLAVVDVASGAIEACIVIATIHVRSCVRNFDVCAERTG
jgi:hypothetical protein